jgi:hypothetical protein
MKRFRTLGRLMAAIACIAMIAPRASWSSEVVRRSSSSPAVAPITDVRMDAHARLGGQLVDRQGRPRSDVEVSLWSRGERIARTRTTADGVFFFGQLRGGLYRVEASEAIGLCRVWTADSAPPAAQSAVLLVDGVAVRAQQDCFTPAPLPARHARQSGLYSGHYDGAILRTLSNPWVVGGAIAAGIAIPLALSDDSNGS